MQKSPQKPSQSYFPELENDSDVRFDEHHIHEFMAEAESVLSECEGKSDPASRVRTLVAKFEVVEMRMRLHGGGKTVSESSPLAYLSRAAVGALSALRFEAWDAHADELEALLSAYGFTGSQFVPELRVAELAPKLSTFERELGLGTFYTR